MFHVEELKHKADGGDLEAMYHLGTMYAFGHGVPRDLDKALHWLKKAAEHGYSEAGLVLQDVGMSSGQTPNASSGQTSSPQKSDLSTGDTKTITLPGGATMEMIYCAPGSFMMGSAKDEAGRLGDENLHRVTLSTGFWLAKYPVTQEQWEIVMGKQPSHFYKERFSWKIKPATCSRSAKHPVERISWNDCFKFIEKIREHGVYGARFPIEAEWEYACRAGTSTTYSFGSSIVASDANYNDFYPMMGKKGTSSVGAYDSNPWGFCDMHGNVFEWCWDWWEDWKDRYSGATIKDPSGPPIGYHRVLRGGCWKYPESFCRSAYRGHDVPSNRDDVNGFRLCCSVDENEL